MADNKTLWDKLYTPPTSALKTIRGGRLSGMTDINPQWRYEALTDALGPCGIGWKYTIDERWEHQGTDGQVHIFVNISLYIYDTDRDAWSAPIPGTGGSTFIASEKGGLRSSDECYKMATTDALSVAAKMLGVGGAIYAGKWDGSKYKDDQPTKDQEPKLSQSELYGNWCAEADQNSATSKQLGEWFVANSAKAKTELDATKYETFVAYVRDLGNVLKEQEK